MAAIFSFGSFGDILSLIQILNDVRRTLSDSYGSFSEHGDLLESMDAFLFSLQCLDRVQVRLGGISDIDPRHNDSLIMDQSVAPRIQTAIEASEHIARQFQTLLQRYNIPPNTSATSLSLYTRVRTATRKIQWALSPARKEVTSLKINLMFQRSIINQILLAILVDRRVPPVFYKAACQSEAIVYRSRFRDLAAQILRSPVVEVLTVVDMLDCAILVPMYHCHNKKVCKSVSAKNINRSHPQQDFHAYMVFLFRERAGRLFVDRGAYTVGPRDSTTNTTASLWQALAQPGATLLMAAIVRLPEPPAGYCPKCHQMSDTNKAVHGIIMW